MKPNHKLISSLIITIAVFLALYQLGFNKKLDRFNQDKPYQESSIRIYEKEFTLPKSRGNLTASDISYNRLSIEFRSDERSGYDYFVIERWPSRISEIYPVSEWINSGYQIKNIFETENISSDPRKSVGMLKDIFDNRMITQTSKSVLEELAIYGGFFGYLTKFSTAPIYIESLDGQSRGLQFFNLQGQDVGVYPQYNVILYNDTKDAIVYLKYYLPFYLEEVRSANEIIYKLAEEKRYDDAYQRLLEFKGFLENVKRRNLTFGTLLDSIDGLMKSLRF